ncbi:class I SAM-dependent DNA methyltransferase [Streptoalloteichus hindustanus]|uniref:Ubiquinone/menaquinone biosynthesis C-methylase UbiE n=1 Tax=Streptoalloteichus hindustanus TaxID=2017 RepID=A0A1M5DF34_STRHI|nr:class I SAM-dependent methyltransferase [Streptoalloteichus hindustanus]SHF65589.1 Ubiquinone/menaquinone biosynthesis C-methylase UbiE [Streptoalloteichus hindustanus]
MANPDLLAATRAAYDAVAPRYAEKIPERYHANPFNHAMVPVFAELIQAHGGGLVLDVGCGPGHVTAHLHALGVTAFGVDLSPEMIGLARSLHPELRFEVGVMDALKVEDAALAGVLANHSIIHTPPERLSETFAEFHRVLAPGGCLLLGFPAYDDASRLAEPFDHVVSLAYRYSPDRVAELLLGTGFTEVARLVISPNEDPKRGFPQAHLLVRRAIAAHGE